MFTTKLVSLTHSSLTYSADCMRYNSHIEYYTFCLTITVVCYGSETGTSLKYANIVAGTLGDEICIGPIPMDSAPALISLYSAFENETYLLVVVTSTFGKVCTT